MTYRRAEIQTGTVLYWCLEYSQLRLWWYWNFGGKP